MELPLRHTSGESKLRPLGDRDRIAVVVKAVVRAADAWGLTNIEGAAPVRRAHGHVEPHEGWPLQGHTRSGQGDTGKPDHQVVQRARVTLQRPLGLRLAQGFQHRSRFRGQDPGSINAYPAGQALARGHPGERRERGGVPARPLRRRELPGGTAGPILCRTSGKATRGCSGGRGRRSWRLVGLGLYDSGRRGRREMFGIQGHPEAATISSHRPAAVRVELASMEWQETARYSTVLQIPTAARGDVADERW